MPLSRPVLAISDLSASSTNAAWRAALVARDLGVALHVLHAQPAADGLPAARRELAALAAEVRDRLGIDVVVQVVQSQLLQATLAAARGARVLVIGSRRRNLLREWILGTQAERLLRLCRIPVLVVKRTATAGYRRVLVPVDLGPAAGPVIAAAARISRDPRMEVLHALSTREELTMRVADVSETVVRGLRDRAARRTRSALEELIAGAGADRQGAVPAVGFGPPASVVLAREQASRAELVVIGKRRRLLLADFFLGSVTQQVLAATRADVLVLPPSDFRDQLDLDAGAGRDLRHAEGAARMRALGPEHLAQQLAGPVDHQVVFGEGAR